MNTIMFNKNNMMEILLGISLSIFIFISYIKSTISINYFLLLIFITLIILLNKNDKFFEFKQLKIFHQSFIFLIFLVAWIVFQAVFIADDNMAILKEVKSQFIVPLLFFLVGIYFVSLKYKILTCANIFNIIFFTGFLHILIIVIIALYTYLTQSYLPIRKVYILPVDEVSFLTNLIYALFLSEIYSRLIYKKHVLRLGNFLLLLIFILFSFSVYLQGMRWGMITFITANLCFGIIILFQIKITLIKKILAFFSLVFLLVFLLQANIKSDNRWNSIIETVGIVYNDNSLYWINPSKYPCPKLKNGACVNMSNYLRLAQMINGIKLIKDFPFGVGYSRYSYKIAINKKYHNNAGVYDFPHSGMLNLLIGIGIPGMILYLLFFFFLIKILLTLSFSYYKVFTLFFIVAFHIRGIVDMTFMNHNLKVFMLLVGIGIICSLIRSKDTR